MDAAGRGKILESERMKTMLQKHYQDMLSSTTCPTTQAPTGKTASMKVSTMASILGKDMESFFEKRDDLLREVFLDKLAGDKSKWKFATSSSTHQVVIKGPKGWSIVGNKNEGQLLHEAHVIARASNSDYQSLKPMAVSIIQVIQNAMDSELERLKTSLVEDLDVQEEDNGYLPSFLNAADDVVPDRQYNSMSAF